MRTVLGAAAVLALAVPARAGDPAGGEGGAAVAKAEAARPAPPEPAPLLPGGVEGVLLRIREAGEFRPGEGGILGVLALGRGAIPDLLLHLRRAAASPADRRGADVRAAAWALAEVVDDRDFEAVAGLLRAGLGEAARALRGMRHAGVRGAVAAALRKGLVAVDLLDLAERFAGDPEVRGALLARLERSGKERGHAAGRVAEILGRAGAWDARPLLRALLEDGGGEPDFRRMAATALLDLGDRSGVPVLLEFFYAEPRPEDPAGFSLHRAGEVLNRLAGERIWTGVWEADRKGGNVRQARERFAAWWAAGKDALRFDPVLRRWSRDRGPVRRRCRPSRTS
jgi:hypothetical protein